MERLVTKARPQYSSRLKAVPPSPAEEKHTAAIKEIVLALEHYSDTSRRIIYDRLFGKPLEKEYQQHISDSILGEMSNKIIHILTDIQRHHWHNILSFADKEIRRRNEMRKRILGE